MTEESNTLWHGRFDGGPAAALEKYTYSIGYDERLAADDIAGSRVHVRGLGRVGLLSDPEVDQILAALDTVEAEFASGSFVLLPADEDIHTAVERRCTELAPAAAKMHTGRSRNDQIGTDIRLWLKRELGTIAAQLVDMQQVLFDRAVAAGDAYLPGYTHFQRAQPVPLAHHLLAHAWTFGRDITRILAARDASDVSVLGAGALAGSSLPLDPDTNAIELGFSRRFENSLDAVSDRDFIADAVYALTMIGIHLSRIGEEWVLWSSGEMGFVVLDDGYATGSSMMPQKKNPDIAELARGKAGRIIGNLTGLLATLKSLPLTYNRDLQEDKEPLFDSLDQISAGLEAIGGMIATATFNTGAMADAADDPLAGATDLAEYLVRSGVAFRDAHAVVGTLVREALSTGLSLIDLTRDHDQLGPEAAALLQPGRAVHNRITPGGAGLVPLQDQLARFEAHLAANRATVESL
jgi:argininosuccinate lyase